MIGNLWHALGQRRAFRVTLSTPKAKRAMRTALENSAKFNCHYGFFFTTTGCAWGERIDAERRRDYEYFFRTDQPTNTSKL